MKASILISLSFFASLCYSEETATKPTYVRPLNEDCVAKDLGLSVGPGGVYFPSEFILDGQQQQSSDSDYPTIISAAEGFAVTYYNTYKVVENRISNITYVLYECGTDKPDPGLVPDGAVFFQVPLTSVSVSETVPYAFLEALEVENRVLDVSGLVTSACGQKLLECGKVAPSYVSFSDFSVNEAALDEARAVADAVILGSAGTGMGAPILAFDAENDPGLLNRAEWIKYLGLFFNREKQASELYNAIVESYNEVKSSASASDANSDVSPTIAWVSHFLYKGEEHFDVSFADYKSDIIADVGGTLPVASAQALVDAVPGTRLGAFSPDTVEFAWDGKDSFESKAAASAAFQEFLSSVDAVVDETYALDPSAYNFAAAYGFDQPDDLLVYRLDGRLSSDNGYDWFESSFVRPDLVLRDFQRIADSARKGKNVEDFDFTWLRNINEPSVVVTADECSRIQSCDEEPAPICPFVQPCGDGTTSLLLEDAQCPDGSSCCYESCDMMSGGVQGTEQKNTAQMAAPAVILITLLIVFVEALINFC